MITGRGYKDDTLADNY